MMMKDFYQTSKATQYKVYNAIDMCRKIISQDDNQTIPLYDGCLISFNITEKSAIIPKAKKALELKTKLNFLFLHHVLLQP